MPRPAGESATPPPTCRGRFLPRTTATRPASGCTLRSARAGRNRGRLAPTRDQTVRRACARPRTGRRSRWLAPIAGLPRRVTALLWARPVRRALPSALGHVPLDDPVADEHGDEADEENDDQEHQERDDD